MPRFIKNRSFKDFDAQKLFNSVLDTSAPIKEIQMRHNYAPWMSKETKDLKIRREESYNKKSIDSDHPDDWRRFRSLRNQAISKLR